MNKCNIWIHLSIFNEVVRYFLFCLQLTDAAFKQLTKHCHSLKTLNINRCNVSVISLCSSTALIQGSCAGLEFKAGLEKSLNFVKLKMSLNCFGKRVEGLEKFGICLCEIFNKTW